MIVTKCTVYCRYWRYKPGLKTEPYCKNQKKPCAEAALTCEVPRWITSPIRGEYEPLPPKRKPEYLESLSAEIAKKEALPAKPEAAPRPPEKRPVIGITKEKTMPIKPEKTPKLPESWPIKGNGGKLVGSRAATEILGLCPHSVSELCSKKIMCVPFYKIGGRFRFDLADLEAYIRKARVEGKKSPWRP